MNSHMLLLLSYVRMKISQNCDQIVSNPHHLFRVPLEISNFCISTKENSICGENIMPNKLIDGFFNVIYH